MDLKSILKQLVQHKAPDLHLKVGSPPIVRLTNGDLYPIEGLEKLTEFQISEIARDIVSEDKYKLFSDNYEIDFSYGLKDVGRFRVNLFLEKDGPALAFRAIPEIIPSPEDLLLPSVLHTLAMKPRGLVLVTGPTGSGKSTTLASMIHYINQRRRCHIITIEDPIEFVHTPIQALITQREVSYHTRSFSNAIRSSLRQDPDVIMVGEMRDLETIATAITLAEAGHLVLSTLHTTDAAQTIHRIVDVFPSEQQQQIRLQLALSLQAVISQTMLQKIDGKGRVVAFEIMIANDAVRNLLKEAQIHQILSMIQIGRSEGMQTLDDALANLCKKGLISEDAAYAKAHDPDLLRIALHQTS